MKTIWILSAFLIGFAVASPITAPGENELAKRQDGDIVSVPPLRQEH